MRKADGITAAAFLLFLAAMLAVALSHFSEVKQTILESWHDENTESASLLDKAAFVAEEGDGALSASLDPEHWFIQLYGGAQRLMGRRYVADMVEGNSVVKLDNGALSFAYLTWTEPEASQTALDNAQNTTALCDWLGETPFLAVIAPQKIASNDDLPGGLTENGNANADGFLSALSENGVDALDLRPAFDSREDRDELFFRTDHHWRVEGAFFAYQVLAGELEERYGFATPALYTDLDSYTATVCPGWFLGSQGKRVGSLYAGTDDFTVLTPDFETSFTYSGLWLNERSGSFSQALCFPEYLENRDWFNGNPYVYYSGGDYGYAVMENHLNPDGPKILLIRDSYSCALAPFLALSCSKLVTVDLRSLDRPLAEVVEEENPDLVMLLYTASTTGLDNMFAFNLS